MFKRPLNRRGVRARYPDNEAQPRGGALPGAALLGLFSLVLFSMLAVALESPAHGSPKEAGVDGSPASTARSRVTLAQLLAFADRHAPTIAVARAKLRLGVAAVRAASPLLPENPEVEVSAGPRLSDVGGYAVDLRISLRQRFEIAGERGLRIRKAERSRDRRHADLRQVRWQVHQKVHGEFLLGLVIRERIKAASHLVTFARRLLAITRKRQAAGAVSMLHVKVAEGEFFQAEQEKVQADSAYQAIRLVLAEVCGWPAGSLPEPVGELRPFRGVPGLHRLTERALARHPDLHSRLAAIKEAEARVELADREVFPKPALGISYSLEAEVAGEVNHLIMGTLGLSIPLWQRNQGERARARAAVDVARAEHSALEQMLRTRVARGLAALNAAARRVEAFGRDVVPTFQQNLALIRRAFQEGKVDVLQVMVARGRFLAIQRQALDAQEDYFKAQNKLEAMVGADIWHSAEQERPQ